ncbi:hypothetical protein B7O87_09475 [Cylindrospermopsis raciborskii CENA303]|uniref:Phospholipase n=1 Tax=Cylindrospermopsis raciborskii CENA303 TaxID=1170769 RepID=A0A1X4G6I9_9CYAN|nr:hypothetical protein BCV64_01505 [Cylindrospermopsis raciborskii MVCC14]OSO90577.1 hypothetical protein B7O87_09475 [Cylindrospermopsis raciborskii CENA303]
MKKFISSAIFTSVIGISSIFVSSVAKADFNVSQYAQSQADGCTAFPDRIRFAYDFTGACNSHDWCYSYSEVSRKNCDDSLLREAEASCNGKRVCLKAAQVLYKGVRRFGQPYFLRARQASGRPQNDSR